MPAMGEERTPLGDRDDPTGYFTFARHMDMHTFLVPIRCAGESASRLAIQPHGFCNTILQRAFKPFFRRAVWRMPHVSVRFRIQSGKFRKARMGVGMDYDHGPFAEMRTR